MPIPAYVTADDMEVLFPPRELRDVTNIRNPERAGIESDRLEAVCTVANGVVYGYLSRRYTDAALQIDKLKDGFIAALRLHAANIAMHQLDGSTEVQRNKYEDAIKYLEWLLDSGALDDGSVDGVPGVDSSSIAGRVDYDAGREVWNEWRVCNLGL